MLKGEDEFTSLRPLCDISSFRVLEQQYALEKIEDRFICGLIAALGAGDGIADMPLIFRVGPAGESSSVGPVNREAGDSFA